MNPLSEALSLLVVGMTSVFVVLALIVLLGKLTLAIANRYPEVKKAKRGRDQSTISSEIMSVLIATVDFETEGRGRVERIEKI